MNYFPTSYPDELLYSILARYHVRNGNISPKMTLHELFGTNTITAVGDMPSDIDSLVCRIPKHKRLTADGLIMNNTLFPYYTAFMPEARTKLIEADMKGNGGGKIHTMAGIMAGSINVPEYLRFCPECNKDDEQKYGENYWHRLHQMPGVLFCPVHNEMILDSTVNLKIQNRHEFIAANEKNCLEKHTKINYTEKDINSLITLSEDIDWIIKNYENVKDFMEKTYGTRNYYIEKLKDRGYATVNGRVYQENLVADFIEFYGFDFLNSVQCPVDYNNQNNWLSSIVRKHRKVFHIVMHLLLIRFLYGSAEKFINIGDNYKPFGTGPWPCLNPVADHYKKFVIKKAKITHCYDTKHPVGTFECSCGFIYSRRGPDTSPDDLFKVGRIKMFGLVWEKKLEEAINKNWGLRRVAREMKADPKTIKLYSAKLGLKTGFNDENIHSEKGSQASIDNVLQQNDSLLYNHRNAWLLAKKTYPDKSKTELRSIAKAHYAWLYRHDKDWLDKNSPEHQKIQINSTRVDWIARDFEVLQKVKDAEKEILNTKGKPERISLSRIGRVSGLLGLLEKHLDKLPQTKAYIEAVSETDDAYRKRRILWAIQKLSESGEEPKLWKVMRIAGIRKEYEKQAEECLGKKKGY
ncbi:TnsD family transposase [Ruminiclostridium herbifermentans]|uniref:TnsD family transposase n=1 Tax=Ruminiclostridium herbifermentans TaxID=2488810 RepID=A0A4U7JCQ7_9FIRM|nr:TnsD family Tn7-like transposition protein [Ruminiclostridium herbifermentans]QNU68082.1 TnsD family transposase [Ruminiclostridium herbifermentans]